MKELVDGLDYAHTRGVVHRDIKPSNISIDREGPLGGAFVAHMTMTHRRLSPRIGRFFSGTLESSRLAASVNCATSFQFRYLQRRDARSYTEMCRELQSSRTMSGDKQHGDVGLATSNLTMTEMDWVIDDPLRKTTRRHCDLIRYAALLSGGRQSA